MSANDQQVGGSHYDNSKYAHWDLVASIPLDYFEGCSTKYVFRRRKKGALLLDLQKALHFLNKRQELGKPWKRQLTYQETVLEVARFTVANGLDGAERRFTEILATWQEPEDLDEARSILFGMMDNVEVPVPLSEENHHAERAE